MQDAGEITHSECRDFSGNNKLNHVGSCPPFLRLTVFRYSSVILLFSLSIVCSFMAKNNISRMGRHKESSVHEGQGFPTADFNPLAGNESV